MLLPGPNRAALASKGTKRWKARFLKNVLVGFAFLLILGSLHALSSRLQAKPKRKNIVFFVTDGMGPASLSLTRSFRQFRDGLNYDDTLFLDKHLIGSSRTRSTSSLITDSAAGATVFACGAKSYNGAIGVFANKSPCGTVLEALKLDGYLTGLVVTTRITDATPAAFSSHVDYRFQEDTIAEHQLGYYPMGRSVDLILGGGRCHFHGCRADGRNLIDEAKKDGWQYVGNRSDFDGLKLGKSPDIQLPLLGLLADTDIPYDLDRDASEYPSLEEQAITALNILREKTKDSDKGFFLLIEGSRIDHGGHANDPAAQVNEVLAFDKAFKAVAEFADAHADEADTFMVSTSDHETGGLSVAKQVHESYPEYLWYPEVLSNVSHSGEYLAGELTAYVARQDLSKHEFAKYIAEFVEEGLGVTDLGEAEIGDLYENRHSPHDALLRLVNNRAQIGWATHGHSAVDVNVYGHGSSAKVQQQILDSLLGNRENIEVGQFLSSIEKNVDLKKVTKLVRHTKHAPSEHEVGAFSSATKDEQKRVAMEEE